MIVRELIQQLQNANPDGTVYMSNDDEGNQYQEVTDIDFEDDGIVLWPGGEHLEDYPLETKEDE